MVKCTTDIIYQISCAYLTEIIICHYIDIYVYFTYDM